MPLTVIIGRKYSYSSNANNLSAGIYQITTTDEKGCSSSASFTITEPSALSLSILADSVSCFNGNNGSASSLVSGGPIHLVTIGQVVLVVILQLAYLQVIIILL